MVRNLFCLVVSSSSVQFSSILFLKSAAYKMPQKLLTTCNEGTTYNKKYRLIKEQKLT